MTKQAYDVTSEDDRAKDELTTEELDLVIGGTGQFGLAPGGNAVAGPNHGIVWSDLVPFGSQVFNP